MIVASGLNCMYWNGSAWNDTGCSFGALSTDHMKCVCSHLTSFGPQFITPAVQSSSSQNNTEVYTPAQPENNGEPTLQDLVVFPLSKYFSNIPMLMRHKQPTVLSFLLKPGLYLVILFWFMYCTSMVYYSGKDRLRRYKMTKAQNRDDLAEMKNDEI